MKIQNMKTYNEQELRNYKISLKIIVILYCNIFMRVSNFENLSKIYIPYRKSVKHMSLLFAISENIPRDGERKSH